MNTNPARLRVLATLPVLFLMPALARAAVTASDYVGAWDFSTDFSNTASGGAALLASSGLSGANYTFTTATIGGQTANVMQFSSAWNNTQFLVITNPLAKDFSGATRSANYSIFFDVLKVGTSFGSLMQNNDANIAASSTISGDESLFIRSSTGRIDFSGGGVNSGSNTVALNTWNRIGVTVATLDGINATTTIYLNGLQVGTVTNTLAGAGLLSTAALFADNTTETFAAGSQINSVALFNRALNSTEVAGLGGASASGLYAVPEPSTYGLAGAGMLLGASILRRRRRKN